MLLKYLSKLTSGQDWFDDAEERFERYISPQNKIPFDIETLNEITRNGVSRKTLNLILAGIHVGKTMTMVHLASGYARLGFNVLYISLEMSEDDILQRVDANILKVPIQSIIELGKDKFVTKIKKMTLKGYGKVKVIQFPTGSAHSGHFKHILDELYLKKNWKPDVLVVDYIGCVASSRLSQSQTNSHFYLKSVAEELRALAIEYDLACWSGMQVTRSGMSSTDIDLTDIAESIGIPAVCDLTLAATRTEELDNLGQIAIKQLKNRYHNMTLRQKFVLGVDLSRQTIYDVSNSQQNLHQVSSQNVDMESVENKFKKWKGNFSDVKFD